MKKQVITKTKKQRIEYDLFHTLSFFTPLPDALWYINTEGPLYVMLGGRNNRAGQRLSGASGLSLNHFSNYTSVEGIAGASNKYTPDALWYASATRYYARVGGNTHDGLLCGCSCLYLNSAAGAWYWAIGASFGFAPEG